MKKTMYALCALLTAGGASAMPAPVVSPPQNIFGETAEAKAERMKWWTDGRFGMFIHFGLYSIPARGEWIKNRERMTDDVYDVYFRDFNPDLMDVREWARQAKKAGMKYMVLTAKHHEGFCLWDTDTTDYKSTKTPLGRDIVKEYVEACRAEGLGVGLYYSVIDWHHPDYPIDNVHPLKPENDSDWSDELYRKLNKDRDMAKYRRYMFAQVEELMTRYGKIDIVWFDFTTKHKYGKNWKDWEAVELLKMTRKHQPHIIVDNRLGLNETDDGWDFATPEQFKVSHWPLVRGKRVAWETCQTFSGSWGYARDEKNWKTSSQILELLIETVGKGGNLILNVGPTARGEFDFRARERLDSIAKWMHFNSRSIHNCTEAPQDLKAPANTLLTYNASTRRLYIHLLKYPMGWLMLQFRAKVDRARFLHDGSELKVRGVPTLQAEYGEDAVNDGAIILPIEKPPVEIPVVEVFMKEGV